MALGDHLKTRRTGYTHHGVDAGDGTVIEYDKDSRMVRRVDFATFLGQSGHAEVVAHPDAFAPEVILQRALSRIGEHEYDLVRNNCECFATWCCTGRSRSEQVQLAKAAALGLAVTAGTLAVRAVTRRAGRI